MRKFVTQALFLGWLLQPVSGWAVDYMRDIKPLLANQCVLCHGASQQKGGLRLDTGRAVLAGGRSGAVIEPGSPDASPLLAILTGNHGEIDQMPYKRPPLETPQLELITTWIQEGARHPEIEEPSSDEHWAFVPPKRPSIPGVDSTAFAGETDIPRDSQRDSLRHPVDLFILERLREEGLNPSEPADKTTQIRRVFLDLIGLPPSPAEIDAFVNDTRPNAYELLVDRLLESPHYGERWGRWWLDGARYADSNGYSIDGARPIWPYRDWVVQSFNQDMPLDTFTRYQLAGDLIAGTRQPGAKSPDRDLWIATGFHRNTQINHEGGIDPEEFRIESVIDRVNTTASVWLGITLACAQCHDHKFDPLSQADYFQFLAFFNSAENDGHGSGLGPVLEIPTEEEETRLQVWSEQLRDLEQQAKSDLEEAEKKRLEREIQAQRRKRPSVTRTLVIRELAEPRPTTIFIQGDFTRPGKPVERDFPAIFNRYMAPETETSPEPAGNPAAKTLTRLDLADWLVARDNPLTARVMVNRIWQELFGRGLVDTENDFGTMGTPPTHPELLDWLAVEFMESGWHWKPLLRLLVTSDTYRQSSTARDDLREKDPRNLWLGRQNRLRLDAELVRDVALTASGLLNDRIGGPPVYPPQPEGLSAFTQNRHGWPVSQGEDRYRRALYTFLQRSTLYPSLAVFDAPDTFTSCTRRLRSNTPLQALTLLNDTAFFECATALADRMTTTLPDAVQADAAPPGTLAQAFQVGFEWCTGRKADAEEMETLLAFYQNESEIQDSQSAWIGVARILLNLDETITRE